MFILVALVLLPSFVFAQGVCELDPNLGIPDTLDVGCTECTTLTADFPVINDTDTYLVEAIDDATPPFPLNVGTVTISTTDDIWSPLIPLDFPFCFFGQTYQNIVIGSNGLVTFNAASANGACPWSFNQQAPTNAIPTNSIFGVFHDINPATCGNIRYATYGEAPCRTFVISFDNVCLFSCTSLQSSSQIVLYEFTNVIEVYNVNKPACAWNSGSSLIGIQNQAGTVAFVPPGRNTGNWSASNEAWRFVPNGAASGEVSWFQGETLLGTGSSIEICPEEPGTYFAALNYDACASVPNSGDCENYTVNVTGGSFPGEISWSIVSSGGQTLASGGAPFTQSVCLPNDCYTLIMSDSFGDGWNGGQFSISYQGAVISTATLPSGSSGSASFCVDEFVPDDDEEPIEIDGFVVATFFIDVLLDDLDPGLASVDPLCSDLESVQMDAIEPSGTWSADCTDCIDENGLLSLAGLEAGEYTVFYTVEGLCGPVVDSTEVAVFVPESLVLDGPEFFCSFSDSEAFSATPIGGDWTGDCSDCIDQSGVFNPTGLSPGNYTLTYTLSGVCTVDSSIDVSVEPTFTAELTEPDPLCASETVSIQADTPGGVWDADCTACIDADTGVFSGQQSGPGTFVISYDFNELCSIPVSTSISVVPTVDASIATIPELCETGNAISLSAAEDGGVWIAECGNCIDASGVFDPQASGAGLYTVTYSIEGVCSDEDVANVLVLAQRDASFTLEELLCIDAGTYTPIPFEIGGEWSANCAGCIDPVNGTLNLVAAGEGELELTYTFDGLCGASSSEATILRPCSIEVPNIFSPNNDGVNDVLRFENLDFFANSELVVHNRWGQVVFQDPNYNNSNNWDGGDLPEGTYYFFLTLGLGESYQGPITLKR